MYVNCKETYIGCGQNTVCRKLSILFFFFFSWPSFNFVFWKRPIIAVYIMLNYSHMEVGLNYCSDFVTGAYKYLVMFI